VLRNDRLRFRWAVVESLGLGVGDFDREGFQSDKAFRVEGIVTDLGVLGRGVAPGRPREAEDPR